MNIETPQNLIDMGMKLCDECGAHQPLEKQICLECKAEMVIFAAPKIKE